MAIAFQNGPHSDTHDHSARASGRVVGKRDPWPLRFLSREKMWRHTGWATVLQLRAEGDEAMSGRVLGERRSYRVLDLEERGEGGGHGHLCREEDTKRRRHGALTDNGA